jgi:hypothetical protein
MQEVWAVLEIVREQCWLNEILDGIAWMPEIDAGLPVGDSHEAEATEEELRALLSGQRHPFFYLPLYDASIRYQYSSFNTSQCLRRRRPTRSCGAQFPRAPAHARNGQYHRDAQRTGRSNSRGAGRHGRRCSDVKARGSSPTGWHTYFARESMGGVSDGALDWILDFRGGTKNATWVVA